MKNHISPIFKKNIFSNSVLVSFRYAVIAVLGLMISVGFARLSTKEIFGQYQFILSLLAVFSVFSLPGLNISAIKSISKGSRDAVSQVVRLSFIGSLFAIPFLVGYGIFILLTQSTEPVVGWACIVLGIFFPFLNAPNTWYAHYEGRLLFRPVVVRTIISAILTAIMIFFGLWKHVNVLYLTSIWFFSSVFFSWFFYWEKYDSSLRHMLHYSLTEGNILFIFAWRIRKSTPFYIYFDR